MSTDPLALPPDEMRRLGYAAVDALVEATTDWSMPPLRCATREQMRSLLEAPPPEQGIGAAAALERLLDDVVPHLARLDHPRFFGFIPCSGTWPGAIGDFVASALSVYAATWLEASGPTQLELTVLDWFKAWIGFPKDAEGLLTSGGSAANLQAIACARESRVGAMRDDLVLYVSDQAHSSVARAARVLGFRPDQVRVLPTDASLRLRPETLAAAIDVDLRRGLTPLLASVSAGSTSTGAVDPLRSLAGVCRERGLWLHVDGAYGAFAALVPQACATLDGIELADSVTLDPHKWLYQSYECGALLVRERNGLRNAFEIVPPYLRDTHREDDEINLCELGLQLSRTTRAFKVWLSLETFGVAAFRRAIERSLELADHAVGRIERSERLELAAPPCLGIVCFRRRFGTGDDAAEDERNARLVADLQESGIGFASSTTLRGRFAIRLCPMNHVTEREDVDAVLDFLEHQEPDGGSAPLRRSERDVDLARSWLRARIGTRTAGVDPALVRDLPLFRDLGEEDAERLAASTSVVEVAAGTVVVREWDVSRDFYVVLDGVLVVERDGRRLDRLGRGAHFGELAARDWGRGYAYARTATVTAETDARLLAVPEGGLDVLMRLSPALAAAVEASTAARLPA